MAITKTDIDIIQSYFEDESGLLGGHADEVYLPQSDSEVSCFLKDSTKKNISVTVSGAGTGVTGGRIPFGGRVLSTELLNKIVSISKNNDTAGSAVVQPGVTVKDLKKASNEQALLYAPDPTEQSSFIGGNISTNASGSRGLKFGPTRDHVQKLRLVLASGEILNINRGEIFADKDNTLRLPGTAIGSITLPNYKLPHIKNSAGYYNRPGMDLIDLFIGSEGTLAVVTEAEVKLSAPLHKILGGIAFFNNDENAVEFCEAAKIASRKPVKTTEDIQPLSLEFFDFYALNLLKNDYPQIPDFAKTAVLFEEDISQSDENTVLDNWSRLIEKHDAPVDSVWLSVSAKDTEAFREFRHRLPEKVNAIVHKNRFPKTGTDFAVPGLKFKEMYYFLKNTLENSNMQHLVFGHIGESHLHANILPKNEAEYLVCKQLYARIIGKVIDCGGTISAEHGIGKIKHTFLEQMLGKHALIEMAKLKKQLDPEGILNPGNIFPKELL